MSVVSIDRLRLNKQLAFERNLLRELTFTEVQNDVSKRFQRFFHSFQVYESAIKEEAVEQAMEAYLLGAEASQFILMGERIEEIQKRYEAELGTIALDFFDYLEYWQQASGINGWFVVKAEKSCEDFIDTWWKIGIERGERRRRLRLD
ncbi:DUF2521 family protein [Pontibacillus sp. ALD_SL1]|uniref:DUF2521 family protein n=1 Tax=Pontibacillus sp. ALD_SL1 TaxID=2777185 RepID=UPI001A95727D|nr:DUF2521 family protein [Pontibacillus sp. ALD_SL1]QST00224.1 DUF2521 family protein [Pontibacillus sp. ALD_SL1]